MKLHCRTIFPPERSNSRVLNYNSISTALCNHLYFIYNVSCFLVCHKCIHRDINTDISCVAILHRFRKCFGIKICRTVSGIEILCAKIHSICTASYSSNKLLHTACRCQYFSFNHNFIPYLICLIFFSAFARGTITSLPQPQHFILKSMPMRRISKSLLPQGCCFFIPTLSPTFISIRHSSKIYFNIFFRKMEHFYSKKLKFTYLFRVINNNLN